MRLIGFVTLAVLLGGTACTVQTGDPASAAAPSASSARSPQLGVDDDNPTPSPWTPPNKAIPAVIESPRGSAGSPAATGGEGTSGTKNPGAQETIDTRSQNGVHIIGHSGETDL